MASDWESDERPHQPCVVCGGVPDRRIELPELPEVHVVFASSAMCDICAAAAVGGDVVGLTRRAHDGSPEDPDAVDDLVRLVMAWADRPLPPAPPLPADQRHRHREPLSAADRAVWAWLQPRMFDGPAEPFVLRGRIEHIEHDGSTGEPVDVVRDGVRVRLAHADGRPFHVTDGVTSWGRYGDAEDSEDADAMVSSPWDGDGLSGHGDLAGRRTRDEVEVFGFGDPVGPIEPTTYLDRLAYAFAFAAPPHKPYDMRVVVDADTGLVLEQRFGPTRVTRWTSFATGGARPDDATFRWTGPVVTRAQLLARSEAYEESLRHESDTWFAEHVTARTLVVEDEPVGVTLHEWADDGSFQASVDGDDIGVAVARRPRSSDWWNLGMHEVTHRWTDATWDWALAFWTPWDDEPVDDGTVAAVRAWLSGR